MGLTDANPPGGEEANVPRRRLTAGQRRASILAAAATVFGEHGYEHASLDDVATAAGVSKALIYEHFRSKEDLYCELLDAAAADLLDRVVAAGSAGEDFGAPRLEQAARAAFEFVREQPRAFQMLVRNVSEPAIARHQEELAGRGRAALAVLMDQEPIEQRSDLQPRSLELAARMMVGSWYSLAEWWIDEPDATMDEALNVFMGLLWIGLGGLREGRRWRSAEGGEQSADGMLKDSAENQSA